MQPRRPSFALLLAALLEVGVVGVHAQTEPGEIFRQALRQRAMLDATPRANRTVGQYTQTLNAFRAVYRADRTVPDADASVEAVAELLAEEGRLFYDPSLPRAAVEQLEFLRRDFPSSRFAAPALLTQGEIEARDLHDEDAARTYFSQFVASYPRSPLVSQAHAELLRLDAGAKGAEGVGGPDSYPMGAGSPSRPDARAHVAGDTKPRGPRQTPSGTSARDESRAAAPGESADAEPTPTQPATIVDGVPVYRPVALAGKLATVTGIRHWSTASYTRIAIDVESENGGEPPFEASRVANPDRIFFDLHGARLASALAGRAVSVTDGGFLERIRAAQFSGDVVRVVLDVTDVSDYSAFWLPNPSRLIIDVHGRAAGAPVPAPALGQVASALPPTLRSGATPVMPPESTRALRPKPAIPPNSVASTSPPSTEASATVPGPHTVLNQDATSGTPAPKAARAGAPGTFVSETTPAGAAASPKGQTGDSVAAIAALSRQPSRVRATSAPTTAPVSAVAVPALRPATSELPPAGGGSEKRKRRRGAGTTNVDANPGPSLAASAANTTPATAARAAEPDSTGGRSMVRALGLKINRIVVDAGHGGHDSGTLGPGGIEEKDVVLDVALRLGKLLKQRLGADVIFTRDDDTFVPLETRTAIANKAQADLFLSVHANSSPDASARGVETYYLNFTTSADALAVAARENAVSDESIHQLSDLVKKITLQDKIAESREFATDVEGSLYGGLEPGNAGLKDRGVKKAPFVVLIGANMPSILAEISFLTNPDDAAQLRDGAYRQRIAESLYKGVAKYVRSLSGTRLEESAATR